MPVSKDNFQRRKYYGKKIKHWAYLESKKKAVRTAF
jgi:hypothetical protein